MSNPNFEQNIENQSICFRNRLNIIHKQILEKKNLDAILLILCKKNFNKEKNKIIKNFLKLFK